MRRQALEREARASRPLWLWIVIILGAVVDARSSATNQGLEYAELPLWLDVLVVVAWVMFGVNIFMTVADPQVRADVRLASGTSWARSSGRPSSTSSATSPRCFTTGVNQANLNWFYVHNAVGLIFTPLGLGIGYYFIPKAAETPLYSPPALDGRLLVARLRLRLDRRAPHAPRAHQPVAADGLDPLLASC